VRQLKNTIEQAVIMTDDDVIRPEYLPANMSREIEIYENSPEETGLSELLERTELHYLNMYYEKYQSIREAAKYLKMSPTTFLRHRTELLAKYSPGANHKSDVV
jgi:transcriptional regulator with PAS, ATPase and Fis domain